jgi:ribosome-binding factor A
VDKYGEIMTAKRISKVEEAYLKELAQVLHFNVRDPRLTGVQITNVIFTPDLRLAKVYFNVDGGELRQEEVIKGFEKSKGYLKKEVSTRVRVKYVPDMKFYYDESNQVKEHIDKLFDQINEGEHDEEG